MKSVRFLLPVFLLFVSLSLFSQKLTLEESVTGQFTTFAPKTIANLAWLPGTDQYVYAKDQAFMVVPMKGKEKVLLTLEQFNVWTGLKKEAFPALNWLSANTFWIDEEDRYLSVDIKNHTVYSTVVTPRDAANADYHPGTGNLAFTKDNNLLVQVKSSLVAVTNNPKNITSGQSISRVEYGINKGTFWNEQGNKLAFYQKDEINVTDYPLTDYKTVPATVKNVKYPMAGSKSEMVAVGVYDVSTGKTCFLNLDQGKPNDQFYATNLAWSPDGSTVYIAVLNRATTQMQMKAFDAVDGHEKKILFTETSATYVEPEVPLVFIPNHPDQFIWISERDGFNNLYKYNTEGKILGNSQARYEITELLGFDMAGENAFVMATGENPTEMHSYKVSLADMKMTLLTPAPGVHVSRISSTGKYVLDTYSAPLIAGRTELLGLEGKAIKLLLDAPNPLAGRVIGTTELFTIKSSDGSDLWCRMIKPHDFDPLKKYPVVVYVYNGPHVQLVQNNFYGGASLWMHYLAEKGYLVFTLDGHGSAHRGKAFEEVIYRQLGTREMADQLSGAEWLKKQSYVDADRMAVHGWSFGGFMTTSLMLRSPGTFKVGVAGGPVIDWRLYEVMYTERYMDTPEENPDGYQAADLTGYVKNLKGDLLMIHGTDDQTVVMQQNMRFLDACIKNQVQVDFFAYPGHEHNVRGKDRIHLIAKVIDYIDEKLAEPVPTRLKP